MVEISLAIIKIKIGRMAVWPKYFLPVEVEKRAKINDDGEKRNSNYK